MGDRHAAKAGDVPRYIACYTDQMAAALKPTISEQYLRETSASIKGLALPDPKNVSKTQATFEVQFIYQDRTEVQTMFLERNPQGWKIARVDDGQRARMLIPYGTPVHRSR